MTIRRRITTIDEIDDSVDSQSPTHLPVMYIPRPTSDVSTSTPTDFPNSPDDKIETHPMIGGQHEPSTVGRTFADLVVELKNDHRAMAILLTVIALVIFVAKIDSIESLKYPLICALALNIIWFGLAPIIAFIRWLNRTNRPPK